MAKSELSDSDPLNCIRRTIKEDEKHPLVVVIFGASGDLAKKKTYPCLWWLYRDGLLPPKIYIVGYARSDLTVEKIRAQSEPHFKLTSAQSDLVNQFWASNYFIRGEYDKPDGFIKLDQFIKEKWGSSVNRIFYFAIPPSIYAPVSSNIHEHCMPTCNEVWARLIIEKPFGRDLASSDALSEHLAKRFPESQLYRIDHYLGKELVQNLLILRFANQVWHALWDREHIHNVTITFKEPFGTEGRGGYFDQFGIIRDVVQNHLMQILSLIAMEEPKSFDADDIRDAKVKVLRDVEPIKIEDVVVGQYVSNPRATELPASQGYTDDPTVPKDSITPTYVCMILYINNDRWRGVPFVIRAGKALNERKAEVRFQFKLTSSKLFVNSPVARNELVMRVQPDEAVYVKLITKSPGMRFDTEETELDLTYSKRYQHIKLPDAYERLILDVVCGIQTNFVRNDELEEAWRILTPVLDELEQKQIKPLPYPFGSRDGPEQADSLRKRAGYVYSGRYNWPSDAGKR